MTDFAVSLMSQRQARRAGNVRLFLLLPIQKRVETTATGIMRRRRTMTAPLMVAPDDNCDRSHAVFQDM
ncbi:MAG: hypothetical protein CUN53_18280 [Phototrophicales bacterium]|nr:MAG: hypothetical protein CUN53_18280 [Phototrophicales bacterium]